MALKAVITSSEEYEALGESIKAEYTQKGDNYFLDVTEVEVEVDGEKSVYGMEDVRKLKNALQGERTSVADLKKQLKRFEKIKDPDAAAAAIKKLEELGDDPDIKTKLKEQVESTKRQLQEKFDGELAEKDKAFAALEAEVNELLVGDTTARALSKHKLVEGGADLLRPHIERLVKVVKNEENGKREVRVLGKDGQFRVSLRQGETGFMGIDELVESMSKEKTYSVAFKGSEATGSQPSQSRQTPQGKQPGTQQPKSREAAGLQAHTQFTTPTARLQQARAAEAGAGDSTV